MKLNELREYANNLPEQPGVYIMRNRAGEVIYVGKAKKLKNRVSQYFQDSASHSLKTQMMVSNVDTFEVILVSDEFEALVLESSLIKQHMPKYNILLKDDKGFPYLRIHMQDPYPSVTLVGKKAEDGAEYFGPFGSRSATNAMMKAIKSGLKLPDCNKKFPRDIGKGRPCLNYHMGLCDGWCQKEKTQEAYLQTIDQVRCLLRGNHKGVTSVLRKNMISASDSLNFELAAYYRDRIAAIENLSKKQLMISNRQIDTDVIGFSVLDNKSCFAVLHFCNGNLVDKEYEILQNQENAEELLTSLVKQYYLLRKSSAKSILLPFVISDMELIEKMFSQENGKKVSLHVPQRGIKKQLVEIAQKNAYEELVRITSKNERRNSALRLLGEMIGVSNPSRMESFDISNISGTDIVAGMVVFVDGKPKKSEYKRFKIELPDGQDDYASMSQAVTRRFAHFLNGDKGFDVAPDVLLIDGGINHAATVRDALERMNLSIPVFGMVKDDRHRTRALVTPHGEEIGISGNQSVFSLIGNIQEETHNYAISYHRKLRSNRLKHSQLDNIAGIGNVRKQQLLKKFKSVAAIRSASLAELERVLPKNSAYSVFKHFHKEEDR